MHLLKDRPVFVAWAMKDPVFTPNFIDEFWRRTFPKAEVLRLTDAGHYLQEDTHEEIVPALLRFLESTKSSSPRRVTPLSKAASVAEERKGFGRSKV